MKCIKPLVVGSFFAVFATAYAADVDVETTCAETSSYDLNAGVCSGESPKGDDTLTESLSASSLATADVLSISSNSATVEGRVMSSGRNLIVERGMCWSTATLPNLTDSCLSEVITGSGKGAFSMTIMGLQGGTIYYVRSFATNAMGTVFGNEKSFKTTSFFYLMTLPKVKTFQ